MRKTTTAPITITQADASAIAARLIPGPWVSHIDQVWPEGFLREEVASLVYAGYDPLLEGATLTCFACSRAARRGQYTWGCAMQVKMDSGRYVNFVDTLPVAQRDTWGEYIHISATKSIGRIAKELQTRLLSHYLPAYRHGARTLLAQGAQ